MPKGTFVQKNGGKSDKMKSMDEEGARPEKGRSGWTTLRVRRPRMKTEITMALVEVAQG